MSTRTRATRSRLVTQFHRAPAYGFAVLAAVVCPINAGRAQAQWTLVEELRIGTGDAEPYSFTDIRGIAVGMGGRIFVLDFKAQEIRMFDAAGKFVKLAARRGRGPGEISNANGLGQGPDGSIWVNDPANSRLSVFKPDGSFLRQHVVPINSYGFVWEGAIDTRGYVNDPVFVSDAKGGGAVRIRQFGPDGAPGDTVAMACDLAGRGPATWKAASKNGGNMYMAVPFSPTPRRALDRRGFVWCTTSETYRVVRVRLGTGDTVAVAERKIPTVPVTAEERARAIASADSSLKRFETTDADFSQIPKTKPFIDALHVDDSGRLWVRRPTTEPNATIFDVFDERGRLLASVRAPFRIDQHRRPEIRGDEMYAVALDEDDVQHVVRARVRR
jgi:hypothetical protein